MKLFSRIFTGALALAAIAVAPAYTAVPNPHTILAEVGKIVSPERNRRSQSGGHWRHSSMDHRARPRPTQPNSPHAARRPGRTRSAESLSFRATLDRLFHRSRVGSARQRQDLRVERPGKSRAYHARRTHVAGHRRARRLSARNVQAKRKFSRLAIHGARSSDSTWRRADPIGSTLTLASARSSTCARASESATTGC